MVVTQWSIDNAKIMQLLAGRNYAKIMQRYLFSPSYTKRGFCIILHNFFLPEAAYFFAYPIMQNICSRSIEITRLKLGTYPYVRVVCCFAGARGCCEDSCWRFQRDYPLSI
jgi:hypothetical protein